MTTTGVLLHTATVSHHHNPRGGLRTAQAVCTDCTWARVIALTALEDVTPSERTKQRFRDALEAEQAAYRRMAAAQRNAA